MRLSTGSRTLTVWTSSVPRMSRATSATAASALTPASGSDPAIIWPNTSSKLS
jgi:hypothetical protein